MPIVLHIPKEKMTGYAMDVSGGTIHTFHCELENNNYLFGMVEDGSSIHWELVPHSDGAYLKERDELLGSSLADTAEVLVSHGVKLVDNRFVVEVHSEDINTKPVEKASIYTRFLRRNDPSETDEPAIEIFQFSAETELLLNWEGPGDYVVLPYHVTRFTRKFTLIRADSAGVNITEENEGGPNYIRLNSYPYSIGLFAPFVFYGSDTIFLTRCMRDGDASRVVVNCVWEGPGNYCLYYNPFVRRWILRNTKSMQDMEDQVNLDTTIEIDTMPATLHLPVVFHFGFDPNDTYTQEEMNDMPVHIVSE